MRYFLHLAYNGSAYHGWQRQPHSISVQQVLEETISTIAGEPTAIVGCGRTDTGVHASTYVAHLDLPGKLPNDFLRRLNRMLPADIAIHRVEEVGEVPPAGEHGLHARFSATHRAYRYDIIGQKDAFRQNTAWFYHAFAKLDLAKLNEAASLLMNYDSFAPFCKTNSDAHTMRCDLRRSEWVLAKAGQELQYHIAADRFLRGMVRLIVGACVQVGSGKMSLDQLRAAMDKQQPLSRPLSVPADGLFLTEVRYPID